MKSIIDTRRWLADWLWNTFILYNTIDIKAYSKNLVNNSYKGKQWKIYYFALINCERLCSLGNNTRLRIDEIRWLHPQFFHSTKDYWNHSLATSSSDLVDRIKHSYPTINQLRHFQKNVSLLLCSSVIALWKEWIINPAVFAIENNVWQFIARYFRYQPLPNIFSNETSFWMFLSSTLLVRIVRESRNSFLFWNMLSRMFVH